MENKHLILDMSNILNIAFWRARTVLMEDEAKDKEEIEKTLCNFGVTVFLNIFHMYLKDSRDHKVYCVYDSRGGTEWRKSVNPDYKANRDHSGHEYHSILYEVVDKVRSILDFYPVYQVSIEKSEADDIIYSLGSILQGRKKIISSDADLLQIAQRFEDVVIWHPHTKKYRDIPAYDVVLMKSISGDSSDNISGVPKFGEKRSLKAMAENMKSFTPEQMAIVEKNLQIVDLAKNPKFAENTEKAKKIVEEYVDKYDFAHVQHLFMEHKQKQHFTNSNTIKKLLDEFDLVFKS